MFSIDHLWELIIEFLFPADIWIYLKAMKFMGGPTRRMGLMKSLTKFWPL